MALSSLVRSAASAAPLLHSSSSSLSPSDPFKVTSVAVNRNLNSSKSIFGASSSLQTCSARSIQPIRATATELPPTVLRSSSGGKTKIGIN
ncbi:hypothetical protein Tsubulata_025337, partial [Turnera subulata]